MAEGPPPGPHQDKEPQGDVSQGGASSGVTPSEGEPKGETPFGGTSPENQPQQQPQGEGTPPTETSQEPPQKPPAGNGENGGYSEEEPQPEPLPSVDNLLYLLSETNLLSRQELTVARLQVEQLASRRSELKMGAYQQLQQAESLLAYHEVKTGLGDLRTETRRIEGEVSRYIELFDPDSPDFQAKAGERAKKRPKIIQRIRHARNRLSHEDLKRRVDNLAHDEWSGQLNAEIEELINRLEAALNKLEQRGGAQVGRGVVREEVRLGLTGAQEAERTIDEVLRFVAEEVEPPLAQAETQIKAGLSFDQARNLHNSTSALLEKFENKIEELKVAMKTLQNLWARGDHEAGLKLHEFQRIFFGNLESPHLEKDNKSVAGFWQRLDNAVFETWKRAMSEKTQDLVEAINNLKNRLKLSNTETEAANDLEALKGYRDLLTQLQTSVNGLINQSLAHVIPRLKDKSEDFLIEQYHRPVEHALEQAEDSIFDFWSQFRETLHPTWRLLREKLEEARAQLQAETLTRDQVEKLQEDLDRLLDAANQEMESDELSSKGDYLEFFKHHYDQPHEQVQADLAEFLHDLGRRETAVGQEINMEWLQDKIRRAENFDGYVAEQTMIGTGDDAFSHSGVATDIQTKVTDPNLKEQMLNEFEARVRLHDAWMNFLIAEYGVEKLERGRMTTVTPQVLETLLHEVQGVESKVAIALGLFEMALKGKLPGVASKAHNWRTNKAEVGDKVSELMGTNGDVASKLAGRLVVATGMISYYENDFRFPSPNQMRDIMNSEGRRFYYGRHGRAEAAGQRKHGFSSTIGKFWNCENPIHPKREVVENPVISYRREEGEPEWDLVSDFWSSARYFHPGTDTENRLSERTIRQGSNVFTINPVRTPARENRYGPGEKPNFDDLGFTQDEKDVLSQLDWTGIVKYQDVHFVTDAGKPLVRDDEHWLWVNDLQQRLNFHNIMMQDNFQSGDLIGEWFEANKTAFDYLFNSANILRDLESSDRDKVLKMIQTLFLLPIIKEHTPADNPKDYWWEPRTLLLIIYHAEQVGFITTSQRKFLMQQGGLDGWLSKADWAKIWRQALQSAGLPGQ